jgi:methylmalonyl-CoA carboxyltransferase small subunit
MKLRITVEGVSYDVDVEVLDQGEGSGMITAPPAIAPPVSAAPRGPAPARPSRASSAATGGASGASGGGEKTVKSPIAGTITQVRVKAGDAIGLNQVLLVMEAMKMETNIASPVVGKVKAVKVAAGEAVKQGQVLVEFE